MEKDKVKSVIESLLFVWGEPLKAEDISRVLNIKKMSVINILNEMIDEFNKNSSRGLVLQQYGKLYQITTKASNYKYVNELMQNSIEKKPMSTAALETLSIIAYKQPVTRIDIDLIRGVKSSSIIKNLVDKGLVKEVGKLNKPGKPILFGTTSEFLRHFGLKTLEDLPDLRNRIENGEEKAM